VGVSADLWGAPACGESYAYPGWPRQRWDPWSSRPEPQLLACETLDLSRAQLSTSDVAALAMALFHNGTNLTSLHVGGTSLSDSGATAVSLAALSLANLSHLDMSNANVGPKGAESLASLAAQHQRLHTVLLGWNLIGDGGAVALGAALRRNPPLAQLQVEQNGIGDAGAAALGADLVPNTRLQVVAKCSSAFATLAELHKTMPSDQWCIYYAGTAVGRELNCRCGCLGFG